jgi:hypothetical protein
MAMLKLPTIEKLAAMRRLGMVEALKTQEPDPAARELSFSERFGLLVNQQWNWTTSEKCQASRERLCRSSTTSPPEGWIRV